MVLPLLASWPQGACSHVLWRRLIIRHHPTGRPRAAGRPVWNHHGLEARRYADDHERRCGPGGRQGPRPAPDCVRHWALIPHRRNVTRCALEAPKPSQSRPLPPHHSRPLWPSIRTPHRRPRTMTSIPTGRRMVGRPTYRAPMIPPWRPLRSRLEGLASPCNPEGSP